MTLREFSTLCYLTGFFLFLRVCFGQIASLVLGRPLFKPGTNKIFGISALVAVMVGVLTFLAS